MIWNETKECMSRDEIYHLQSVRLKKLVKKVYHNVEFYRKKMQELGMESGDIRGLEDLHKLPYTTKEDLRENYPFGLFGVPQTEVIRFMLLLVQQVKQRWLAIQERILISGRMCCQGACYGRNRCTG